MIQQLERFQGQKKIILTEEFPEQPSGLKDKEDIL